MANTFIERALVGENERLALRPFVSNSDKNRGKVCVVVQSGYDQAGAPIFNERVIANNAADLGALRAGDWEDIDREVLATAQQRLCVVSDLMAGGLTYGAGDLGNIVVTWDSVSHLDEASVTLDGMSNTDYDNQEFDRDGVVIPITHKGFKIGTRARLASERHGAGLDTTHVEAATYSVARKLEDLVFIGHSIAAKDGANQLRRIPGLLTHPKRATYEANDWALPATTPLMILKDIEEMLRIAETSERGTGPYHLYVNTTYAFRFREDYSEAKSDKTLYDRVMEIPEISAIRFSDRVPVGNAVLVQWAKTTLDLAVISDIQTVQLPQGNMWSDEFQVFAAMAPRIKPDFDGHLCVIHATLG